MNKTHRLAIAATIALGLALFALAWPSEAAYADIGGNSPTVTIAPTATPSPTATAVPIPAVLIQFVNPTHGWMGTTAYSNTGSADLQILGWGNRFELKLTRNSNSDGTAIHTAVFDFGSVVQSQQLCLFGQKSSGGCNEWPANQFLVGNYTFSAVAWWGNDLNSNSRSVSVITPPPASTATNTPTVQPTRTPTNTVQPTPTAQPTVTPAPTPVTVPATRTATPNPNAPHAELLPPPTFLAGQTVEIPVIVRTRGRKVDSGAFQLVYPSAGLVTSVTFAAKEGVVVMSDQTNQETTLFGYGILGGLLQDSQWVGTLRVTTTGNASEHLNLVVRQNYLARSGMSLGVTPEAVHVIRLQIGDADGDGTVTILDFSLLATSFNQRLNQDGFDSRVDFNRDGVVSILDFSILASNFNRRTPGLG